MRRSLPELLSASHDQGGEGGREGGKERGRKGGTHRVEGTELEELAEEALLC